MWKLPKRSLRRFPGAQSAVRMLKRGKPASSARAGQRMAMLDNLPTGAVGMEVGVHLGDFSQELLDTLTPKELHLVDPWEFQAAFAQAWFGGQAQGGAAEMDARFESVQNRFAGPIQAGLVKIHRDYSDKVLAKFADGYFDWIYIDGNHLYEYVVRDLELALRKVRHGGYISGDDYGNPGWWEDGVTKAVDEFAKRQAIGQLSIFGSQFLMLKA